MFFPYVICTYQLYLFAILNQELASSHNYYHHGHDGHFHDQKSQQEIEFGRIKEFDDLLLMYGKEINEGSNLGPAIEEAKRLASDAKFIKEHTSYYTEILELLKDTKSSKVLNQEQQRLNGIISSASYQPDGQMEINYALVRRNILGSFIESAAQYLIHLMQESPEIAMDQIREMMKKEKKTSGDDSIDKKEKVHTIDL